MRAPDELRLLQIAAFSASLEDMRYAHSAPDLAACSTSLNPEYAALEYVGLG